MSASAKLREIVKALPLFDRAHILWCSTDQPNLLPPCPLTIRDNACILMLTPTFLLPFFGQLK